MSNETTMASNRDEDHEDDRRPTKIFIDKVSFEVEVRTLTGAQLRAVPTPPIGDDRDLWLEVRDGDDRKIKDDEPIRLTNGMRFFTTPRHVTPGSANAARI